MHAPAKPLVHFKQREFDDTIRLLRAWPFLPAGTEGYPKAEVTLFLCLRAFVPKGKALLT